VLAIAEKWRPYRSLATSFLFSAAFEPVPPPTSLEASRGRSSTPDVEAARTKSVAAAMTRPAASR
jgi:hypothetical protein